MKGMQTNQEKMEAIAGTVVRLSERSHAIGEITATVASLAEQSNLLAVNAAIEAAKAGEHGKGFAVVAQEVKSLAEQSRQATRQVREILGEIQKSVGAAVMITEQGAKTVWLNRAIAVPLREATTVAARIATGDLRADVPAGTSRDEVGQMLRALGDMVQSWRTLAAETTRGVATLTGAAGEILSSTAQAAASTAETAAAVSQTTATVEEVKQTSLLASEKSRAVSDAAQQAARTAAEGRRALEDSMKGMESIQEKMEAIASTVVRLSERSHAIGEITATVAGLAEQSNLLAVNAAIEAAKAGEHGRGFAVVAQEVKSLAEQSRQATRQVREILGEIQKSVGAAVMITEQGARTVAQGVERAAQAGEAIRGLTDNMTEAAQAAVQIAVSSQQQLAGMDQVVLAMENIQQASTENAAGTRQAEASARNLHALGQSLRQTVTRFQF
jgi:methyl-accepting chemotaxis protein